VLARRYPSERSRRKSYPYWNCVSGDELASSPNNEFSSSDIDSVNMENESDEVLFSDADDKDYQPLVRTVDKRGPRRWSMVR
jgi:hypothetical protein